MKRRSAKKKPLDGKRRAARGLIEPSVERSAKKERGRDSRKRVNKKRNERPNVADVVIEALP